MKKKQPHPSRPPFRLKAIALGLAVFAGAPSAWACSAGDEAALAACFAGTDTTIDLTADITLTSTTANLARDVTINANGFALTGAGSLAKDGAATFILNNTNSYAGGTTISAGTLAVGANNALGSGTVTLDGGTLLGTGNITLSTGPTTFAAGTSTIAAVGGTTLNYNSNGFNIGGGANLVFGLTGVNGTVVLSIVGGSGVTPGSTIEVAGGTLRAGTDRLGTLTSGVDSLTVAGGATFDMADRSATVVNLLGAGTIQTGPTGIHPVLGSGFPTTLTVQAGNFAGNIIGAGKLTKTGGGTLTLSGSNSYTGQTTVDGTLRAGAVNTFSANSAVVLNSGTLDLNDLNQTIGSLASSNPGASVLLGAGTLTSGGNGANTTFAGSISGAGGLTKIGAGTLALSGNNNYSGATTVNNGTLLAVSTNAFGNNSAVTVSGSGILELNGFNVAIGSLAGNGSVSLNGGTLTTGGNNGSTVFTGSITSGGALTKTGFGQLTLTGDNSAYGGLTTINQGSVQLAGINGSLGSSDVTINGGGTLAFSRANDMTAGNNISGAGALQKLDGNRLTLTGDLGGLTGTTTIGAGTLVIDRSTDMVVSSNISGSGSLEKAGANKLTLTGDNSGYSGTTTISGGTLDVGGGGTTGSLGTGAIVNNGALVINRTLGTVVLGELSGAGTLEHVTNFTTRLVGNNTGYSGTITVSGNGVILVGDGLTNGALGSGNVILNNGGIGFDRTDTHIIANTISGVGAVANFGAGTAVLTADNSYGATFVLAGGIQVGNGGTTGSLGSGAVTNNGTLTFNRGDPSYTVSNPISGTGSVTQAGSGNLILTGTNTYTGATSVTSGTLSVNGSITSVATINNGGTLGGNGTVGGINVMSGGILAPGNSIGTLTVNGNVSFAAGSVFRVETDPNGNADRINATGTVTISGGTVDVKGGTGAYARNTTYTILTSGGATTGTFAGITSDLAFLTPSLTYQANAVLLTLQSNQTEYSSVARTPNQQRIAGYLSSVASSAGTPATTALIQQVDGLNAEQARVAFDNLSGTQHASASHVSGAIGRSFSSAILDRAQTSRGAGTGAQVKYEALAFSSVAAPWGVATDAPSQFAGAAVPMAAASGSLIDGAGAPATADTGGIWGQALGTTGRIPGDGNGAGSRYTAGGFMAGLDRNVSDGWLVGGAFGYSRARWSASTDGTAPASGTVDAPQGSLYGRFAGGPWTVSLSGSYAYLTFDTSRTVSIGATTSTASSRHHGGELGAATRVEYTFPMGGWELRPLAGLRYARLQEEGFSETGAGGANLTVDSRTTSNAELSGGARVRMPFRTAGVEHGAFELRVIASHLSGDVDSPVTARLAGQPASFTSNGTPLERNALTFGAGISTKPSGKFSYYADASYEARAAEQSAFAFFAGLRRVW